MIDYILNEFYITTNPPRELIEKLAMLADHEWCSFDKIPKVGLLPDREIEAELLGITFNDNDDCLLIFITDYPSGAYTILALAKYYKFSFKLNYYSVFTLCQGTFEYNHVLDKETALEINQWDYQGLVSFDRNTYTYTYENNTYRWKEELMEYLFNQKVRDEKLDIILGDKVFSYNESLPSPKGRRSLFQKIHYKTKIFLLKYMYLIKNKLSID